MSVLIFQIQTRPSQTRLILVDFIRLFVFGITELILVFWTSLQPCITKTCLFKYIENFTITLMSFEESQCDRDSNVCAFMFFLRDFIS